ncbi:unnamed protein product [Cuscuta epithymum]|uniref:Uncharacterized protein n=1 Tax=Cuscuta epithymum TaxID=186058 RepID=A0AAV0CY30_9ASTE|nr:unnamed protein product [Cuscuta epithymum]
MTMRRVKFIPKSAGKISTSNSYEGLTATLADNDDIDDDIQEQSPPGRFWVGLVKPVVIITPKPKVLKLREEDPEDSESREEVFYDALDDFLEDEDSDEEEEEFWDAASS